MESKVPQFKLDHIHIFTDTPEETASWFSEMFEGELLHSVQSDGQARVDVRFGSVFLYVSRPPADAHEVLADGRRRRGVDHLAFAVEDVDASVAMLAAKGVRVLDQARSPRPGVRAAFVEGPESIRIELMRRDPIDHVADIKRP
jgi:catechol 2,3-dioxygenase-like lactoylglutathione lyase family enzyme